MKKPVFNLEFPPFVNVLKLGVYTFERAADYEVAYAKLQHLVPSSGSEFPTEIQDGSHQVTALVTIPEHEPASALQWKDDHATSLLDVTLLLSIFTGRHVFVDMDEDGGVAVLADHRLHPPFGGTLILSLPSVPMCRDPRTGDIIAGDELPGKPIWEYDRFDMGLEKGINDVLNLISDPAWQSTYERGHFLLLYRQAIQRQILETSFIVAWSIWEHLFALAKQGVLPDKEIWNTSGEDKIRFIYETHFAGSTTDQLNFEDLRKTRNRIVHFGKPVRPEDLSEMERFVRVTERLVALLLGLAPSYALEGAERRNRFA